MQHIQKLNKNAIKMHNKPCAVEVDGKGKRRERCKRVCYREKEGEGAGTGRASNTHVGNN